MKQEREQYSIMKALIRFSYLFVVSLILISVGLSGVSICLYVGCFLIGIFLGIVILNYTIHKNQFPVEEEETDSMKQ